MCFCLIVKSSFSLFFKRRVFNMIRILNDNENFAQWGKRLKVTVEMFWCEITSDTHARSYTHLQSCITLKYDNNILGAWGWIQSQLPLLHFKSPFSWLLIGCEHDSRESWFVPAFPLIWEGKMWVSGFFCLFLWIHLRTYPSLTMFSTVQTYSDDVKKIVISKSVQYGGNRLPGDSQSQAFHAATYIHQDHHVLWRGGSLDVPFPVSTVKSNNSMLIWLPFDSFKNATNQIDAQRDAKVLEY